MWESAFCPMVTLKFFHQVILVPQKIYFSAAFARFAFASEQTQSILGCD